MARLARQIMTVLAVVSAAASMAGCGSPRLVCGSTATIDGHDTILAAVIERSQRLLPGGVRGVPVSFHAGAQEIGRATTNAIGYAVTTARIPPGATVLQATASVGGRSMTDESPVFTWQAGRTILVFDIDGTISRTDVHTMLTGRSDTGSSPLPGSVETVRTLSARYNLLYVTGRPTGLRDKTREWLEANGFPEAPTILAPTLHAVIDVARYKQYVISRLRETYPDMLIGIGNAQTDSLAYGSSGILPVMVDEGKPQLFPDGAIVFRSWDVIGRFFDDNREILENPSQLRSHLARGGAFAVPREPLHEASLPAPPWKTD